jgi:ABC-2 type transport system ATP-binding protein
LSGGQQRRVDLAAGIAGNPDLLFLDEPTTGFDPAARREAWATIGRLASAGTTVVLTTHYLDEAEHLADRVLVFSQGTIVADGPPGQVGRPANMTEIRFCLPPRSFWPTCRPGWRPLRRWPAIR